MTTRNETTSDATPRAVLAPAGEPEIVPFAHPAGCRTYLIVDRPTGRALAVDVHGDLLDDVLGRVEREGWTLDAVVDTHTHADHPSASAEVARRTGAERIAHEAAHHRGVARHPADGEVLELGESEVVVRHAPGHTPDHVLLRTSDAVLTGDSLLIGGVARTDFLGGDAGTLHDTLHRLLDGLPDETRVFPGHDYQGRVSSTLGDERRTNGWLTMESRAEFVARLTDDAPPRPANMDALLQLNRDGEPVPAERPAAELVEVVRGGGARSVLDVRTAIELAEKQVAGAHHVELSELAEHLDDIRRMPAPRWLLCRTGSRARQAKTWLEERGVAALTVAAGGIEAYDAAGGELVRGDAVMSLERQVRIAAGSLVVLGVLLSWLVHPAFVALSLFVGCGLVFAGLTDTCGMGLLLARAPWNKRAETACSVASPAGGCAASAPPPSGGCAASAPPPSAG